MSEEKNPTDVDTHIGRRLYELRRDKEMSQAALGEAVGVTFQQIQKYEWAKNRISASRLYQLAQALGVPIETFFAGINTKRRAA